MVAPAQVATRCDENREVVRYQTTYSNEPPLCIWVFDRLQYYALNKHCMIL
jgi:hypothetical protein